MSGLLSGKRPGAEGAARRKGRSALLRACGLRGLRATSRSFALAQALASALAWLSLAPMPVIPTNHGLRGLTQD